jgi:hypothetical protein
MIESASMPDEFTELRMWAKGIPIAPPVPFAHLLDSEDLRRFRTDVNTVLAEADSTGEPVDSVEITDILREYAEIASWDGPLLTAAEPDSSGYRVDIAPKDLKALGLAPAAVRRVVDELVTGPLTENPYTVAARVSQRVKKLTEREVWQVYLPDGFRMRYFIDEPGKTVHVVYLGPHSDSRNDGREDSVRQLIHRRRIERAGDDEKTGL